MEIQTFQTTPFMTNCYVISDGGDTLVIDPGDATHELLAAVDGRTVTAIVNTHGHGDHCAGNAALMAHTGAPLWIHEADIDLLRAIPEQGRMFGVTFAPSPEPAHRLAPGRPLTVGATVFEVRHAPGHSPGHVVLVSPDCVIAGDVLFAGSIGRTDLPGGNHQQLLESIRSQLLPLNDDCVVYPGHGPATTIGTERATNPFLQDL